MSISNTKPRTSQASEIAKAQQLIVGLGKHLANASFTVASTSYTSAEVTSAPMCARIEIFFAAR